MKMIRITKEKKERLSGYVGRLLSIAGKMMQCIEDLEEGLEDDDEYGIGERRGYGRIGMKGAYDEHAEPYQRERMP